MQDRREQLKDEIIEYKKTKLFTNELGKMIMNLSATIVYKEFKGHREKDELISTALLGVSEVLLNVDTSQSANTINNYLWICGKNAIKNAVTKARNEEKKIIKYKEKSTDDPYTIIDNKYTQDDYYYNGKKPTGIK